MSRSTLRPRSRPLVATVDTCRVEPAVSVILPTRERAAKLGACLDALSTQTLPPDRYEVLVALDGEDAESERLVARLAGDAPFDLRLLRCPARGIAHAKNELLHAARGRFILSINDDILPEPGFVEAHLRAQEDALSRGGAMVLGATPWVIHEPDRLFDRLIRDTSMVFFYDRMLASPAIRDPDHDWGFRHAWNMNLSMPRDAAIGVGGYTVFPDPIYYEDLELAHRLQRQRAMPVLYRPEAVAKHDHRYEPRGYLAREEVLGRTAWGVAKTRPEFAREVFGRDIATDAEIAFCRESVDRDRPLAERLRASFERTASLPSSAVDGPQPAFLLNALYEQHLPLKRWHWRVGFLRAVDGQRHDGVQRAAHRAGAPEVRAGNAGGTAVGGRAGR